MTPGYAVHVAELTGRHPGGVGVRAAGRRGVVLAMVIAVLTPVAVAQIGYDFADEPLLASAISETDIALRARYVRQWREPDGTLVLLLNGDFQLDMGARRLRASDAVVWINTDRLAEDTRRHWHLTVYLSGDAEVHEIGGTVTVDSALLVRGLRTYGRVLKEQDAHATESLVTSPLYQRALRERQQSEAVVPDSPERPPAVTRPGEIVKPEAERAPRVVRYQLSEVEPVQTETNERVFVASGGVYFSQAGGFDAPMLEIRAQNAVVFPGQRTAGALFTPPADEVEPEEVLSEPAEPTADRPFPPPPPEGAPRMPNETPAEREPSETMLGMGGGTGPQQVRAVYLEGDVVLSLGTRFVRADRLYYDFEHSRALILDAVFRAEMPDRDIPMYVRAETIRQLSAREFAAEDAVVTTSEFYTPSYHVGADRIVLRDATPRDSGGRASGPITGTFELYNATLNVQGLPLLWWPYSQGTLQESETLIRSLRTGYSSDRGYEFETEWYLFNLAGVVPPEGYDATLRLDYFTQRGPAIGVDVDYEREHYFGLLRSYYIHDDGEDSLGPLRRDQEDPTTHERGRVLLRHRHFLSDDWEATVEAAYVSDPYFLEEYEKSEWFEGKEQETLLYLKRARDTEVITLLANWRLLDFVTQTEHLPELTYQRIGDTFLNPLVLYHESRIANVRYRTDDRNIFDRRPFRNDGLTGATFRGDVRQEVELPLRLGPLNVVPFATVRGSYWDAQPRDDGGLWRGLGVYGVRGGTSFSRVFDDAESELFDVHRLRHIVQPQFAAWWAHSNTRSELITPFDYGVETIDDFYGVKAGVYQIWQTKRGPVDNRRSVDLLTLNLEAGFFGDVHGRHDSSNGYANPLRPENSRTRNYFAGEVVYRLSDTTSLLYDFNLDLNDFSYDRHNVALAVERNPRLAYVIGSRYAGDIDMNLIGGGWNYRLNPKHTTAVRVWYDIDTGDLGEIAAGYIRKLPRWYVAVNFEYDNIDDDFTVSLALWPEGIPEWTLGSRRFTGVATSTGIRP